MKRLAFLMSFSLFTTSAAYAKSFQSVDGKKVEIKSTSRIVALNSTTFEIINALGEIKNVVGIDNGSMFLEAAKGIEAVGHPYRPSVEGIISLKPSVVIATQDSLPTESVAQLRTAKVPVLILSNSYLDGYDGLKKRIQILGDVLNKKKEATLLVQNLETQINELKQKVEKLSETKKVFFLYAHSPSDASIYGKETGSHFLIELVGAKNAADFATGVKPLTAEAMVQASPDAIIMLQRGFDAVGGVKGALKMPGVALTPAGKNKKIIIVDNTVRWVGPRFPEFANKLFSEINTGVKK